MERVYLLCAVPYTVSLIPIGGGSLVSLNMMADRQCVQTLFLHGAKADEMLASGLVDGFIDALRWIG